MTSAPDDRKHLDNITIESHYSADQWAAVSKNEHINFDDVLLECVRESLRHLPPDIAAALNMRGFMLSVTYCDDKEMRTINREYRNKDKSTNVLSFPQFAPETLIEELRQCPMQPPLGDMIFAIETLLKEAEEGNKPLLAHYKHLCVHSFLHLLGYDHEENNEAQIMETLEIEILTSIGISTPYQG